MKLLRNGTLVRVDRKHYPEASDNLYEITGREIFHSAYAIDPTVFYYLVENTATEHPDRLIVNARFVK